MSVTISPAKEAYTIELTELESYPERKERTINLSDWTSMAYAHGDSSKKEPKFVVVLKVDGKRHRFGFDDTAEYNRWKLFMDRIFNSTYKFPTPAKHQPEVAVNGIYQSLDGKK